MLIALHKNARTTPAIRAEMASSTLSAGALARQFGVSVATASKWKKRPSAYDLYTRPIAFRRRSLPHRNALRWNCAPPC